MEEPENKKSAKQDVRRKTGRWHRLFKWVILCGLALTVAAELFLRFYIGMGDPPLMMVDSEMEYRFQPNKTYHRFGRLIHYNAYSQRADDFPAHKSSPEELRVMVIGDSVVNGGAPTDQSEVVTAILQKRLRGATGRRVIVGNISAASWGPPNQLAYVDKFGLFDADVVVLVFNDLDAFDAMTFKTTVSPISRPPLALWEVWTKYLPMYTARFRAPPPPEPAVDQADALPICMNAIRQLVSISRTRGAQVIVVQHRELADRLPDSVRPQLIAGHEHILNVSRELGIEPIQLSESFAAAIAAGKEPYRAGDYVHPSVLGNELMADAIFPAIQHALLKASTQPDSTQPSAK